jgi:hypothetical protein
MELFGVAIVVLVVGMTLLVLWRSASAERARRPRGEPPPAAQPPRPIKADESQR